MDKQGKWQVLRDGKVFTNGGSMRKPPKFLTA